ncbi:OsmC family protein [Rugosimonospora africana]|uniref:Osmotically inducible protein C n=1 Tax=Rugosimonospora africana TaxID=556532 RepID=A0A8J3QV76_9ACTN|nr:OsmC family protein [Rugosimonospora africana]GIH16712.1 osmotically inducible protein C [Rugosimonospora africana]
MTELKIERTGTHTFTGTNARGATVRIGGNDVPGAFTPGELLQIATAGCAALTVEELLTQCAGDDAPLTATVSPERAPDVREYERLRVTLYADLSFLDDATHARVLDAMHTAIRTRSTVTRTVERGAPIELSIEPRPS